MKTVWEFGLKGARSVTQRPPILSENQVIVTLNHGLGSNFQGTLVALDLETGTEKWRFGQPHFFTEPTLTSDGSCLVTSFNGLAHKIGRDGQLAWSTKLSERNLWSGSLQDGSFIVSEIAGGSKMTWAIDAQTGKILWQYENGGHFYGLTRSDAHSIVLTSAHGMFESQSYSLHCIDLSTGDRIWTTASADVLFQPTAINDLIVVGSRDKILAFDKTSGALVSTLKTAAGSTFRKKPIYQNDMLIWASDEGLLTALETTKKKRFIRKDAQTLTSVWDKQFDTEIEYMTQGRGGLLVLTKSGVCHKIDSFSGQAITGLKLPRYKSGMGIIEVDDTFLIAAINRNCTLLKLAEN